MASYVETPTRSDTAAGAIAQFLRVKTPGAVAVAGAADVSIGTMEFPCLAAGPCTIRLRSAQGTRKMVCSEGITAGNSAYAAASGKIAASGTVIEGVAMETSTANNDVIEVMPIVNVDLVSAGGITLPTVTFNGATGANEIVVPTNLADALSVEDSAGDLVVVTTTTGSQAITITPATTVTGVLTSAGGITISGNVDLTFSGTTGQPEIVVPDNLADALSVKDAGGGADILVITTTNSAETIYAAVPIRYKVVTTAVAAAGSAVADAGQLARANIVHVTSDGATKGVKLATGVMGDEITIVNDSSTACELYAASGGTINGLAADASVVIPASKGVWCQCTAADTWIAFDLAAKATAS